MYIVLQQVSSKQIMLLTVVLEKDRNYSVWEISCTVNVLCSIAIRLSLFVCRSKITVTEVIPSIHCTTDIPPHSITCYLHGCMEDKITCHIVVLFLLDNFCLYVYVILEHCNVNRRDGADEVSSYGYVL